VLYVSVLYVLYVCMLVCCVLYVGADTGARDGDSRCECVVCVICVFCMFVFLCLYVCMLVCMYVCMYVAPALCSSSSPCIPHL
jgi:hypothetical protein